MSESAILLAQKCIQAPARHKGSPIALLRQFSRTIARRLEKRRAENALFEMPDHILKDIGLTRSQITGAVMHGRYPGRK